MAGLLPAIAIPAVRRRLAQAVELTELAASRPACAALMRNGVSGAFPLQPGQHTADIDRRVAPAPSRSARLKRDGNILAQIGGEEFVLRCCSAPIAARR